MNALILCGVLIAVGAIPVLPVFLGKASRSARPRVRATARVVAFVLLLLCFVLTASGLLALFLALFARESAPAMWAGSALFVLVGALLSYHVVFRKAA